MNDQNTNIAGGFAFSDEQTQFRDSVRRFFDATCPTGATRTLMEHEVGFDRTVWQRMNDELGLAGIHLPEVHGGAGFGAVELGIVLEEGGRALVCAPLFGSSALAASAIMAGADEAVRAQLLPALAAGEQIACLALAEPDGHWWPEHITLTATPAGDGYRVNGCKKFVVDGMVADLIVVAARAPGTTGHDGIMLLTVDPAADGFARRPLDTLDRTRRQAEFTFNEVAATALSAAGAAAPALERTLDFACVALAHEMVGGSQALLDAAVAYAGLRMQFGRVIGSFQAIKHKCADLLLAVELAKSAAYYAAAAIDASHPDSSALAATAKALASDTYMRAAADCIQIHGGIGFTWDHDTHLWYRRAKSSEVLLGDAAFHRERYLRLLEAAA